MNPHTVKQMASFVGIFIAACAVPWAAAVAAEAESQMDEVPVSLIQTTIKVKPRKAVSSSNATQKSMAATAAATIHPEPTKAAEEALARLAFVEQLVEETRIKRSTAITNLDKQLRHIQVEFRKACSCGEDEAQLALFQTSAQIFSSRRGPTSDGNTLSESSDYCEDESLEGKGSDHGRGDAEKRVAILEEFVSQQAATIAELGEQLRQLGGASHEPQGSQSGTCSSAETAAEGGRWWLMLEKRIVTVERTVATQGTDLALLRQQTRSVASQPEVDCEKVCQDLPS